MKNEIKLGGGFMAEKEKKEKKEKNKEEIKKYEEKIQELENLLKEKEKEIEELKDKYLRAYAEMENMKKRLEKEKKEAIEYANETLLKEILPFIDNIERAIEHANENSKIEDFIKGIELTLDNLLKTLEKFGVKQIEAKDKPFDPNYHEAMGVVETEDVEPNTVVEEMQKGYIMKNRLLRPSLVTVSKAPNKN